MKNWGNWSYSELKKVIDEAKKKGNSSVTIDQEHTDLMNDQQVEEWLKQMNLKFETRVERTTIYLK